MSFHVGQNMAISLSFRTTLWSLNIIPFRNNRTGLYLPASNLYYSIPRLQKSSPLSVHHNMSSISLGKRRWDSTWDGLPAEIQFLIFEALMQDGCTLSRLATVSRGWQTRIERHNFAQIRLTPSRLADFGSMIHRNRALVRYIWFCLELDDYNCTKCAPTRGMLSDVEYNELLTITDTDHCPITTSVQGLFSNLSTWDPNGALKLDISIYSLSDSQHWFKYLTFMPDAPTDTVDGDGIEQKMSNKVFHDPEHG